jgi:hypothetical protein
VTSGDVVPFEVAQDERNGKKSIWIRQCLTLEARLHGTGRGTTVPIEDVPIVAFFGGSDDAVTAN